MPYDNFKNWSLDIAIAIYLLKVCLGFFFAGWFGTAIEQREKMEKWH